MVTQTPERTPWHDDGFAEPPKERVANGGERIYRAYGGSSGVLGNCAFFTPSGIFKQIRFMLSERQDLSACVKQLGFFGLAVGRYARAASARARMYRQ